jgi:capsular exopolysaccharide synthesis family protein
LAVAFAQIGLKTLLIDGDLRTSTINRIVRPPKARAGLRQSLASGHRDFREFIEPEVVPDLSILYSGGAAADGQELLAGDSFRLLLSHSMRDFDITILDTPAANSCSDARLISAVVGYSLVVARRNQSLVADIKTLIGQLQADHAHVVGTVLNEA